MASRQVGILAICLSAGGLLMPGSALGQDADEIVVTAQRRTERQVDVPATVTVLSAERLEQAGVGSSLELQQVAPGVMLNRFGAFTAPSIRGVSTRIVGPGADNNVAMYVDGFYIANTVGVNRSTADVQSLEILRGPQGTLFGRNATGGAILITTAEPPSSPVLRVNAHTEDFNGRGLDVLAGAPISDRLSFNLFASHEESDGWLENVAPGSEFDTAPREHRLVRARLRYAPTPELSILLSLEAGEMLDGTAYAMQYYAHPLVAGALPSLLETPYQTALSHPEWLYQYWRGAYLRAEWDLGWATLRSYTGYREDIVKWDLDFDGSPGFVSPANPLTRAPEELFTQEINLSGDASGRARWVVGLFYYDQSSFQEQVRPSPEAHFGVETRAWSAYADGDINLTGPWWLTAGVRYSFEEKECFAGSIASPTAPLGACPGGDPVMEEDAWTPRLGLRYALDSDSSLYLMYSRGFKSGVFSAGSAANPITPETIDAIEFGYKAAREDWRLEAAAYVYQYDDIQYGIYCTVASPPTCPAAGVPVFVNAAESEIWGVEIAYAHRLTEHLSVEAALAYNHARFTDFPNAGASAPSACANPDPNLCANVSVAQDWTDQPLVRAPDWSASVQVNYEISLAFGRLNLAANIYYVDEYQPNSNSLPCTTPGCGQGLSPTHVAPSYTLVGGEVRWTGPNERYYAALYARNLTDEVYLSQADANGLGDWRIYGEPRVIGLRVGYRY